MITTVRTALGFMTRRERTKYLLLVALRALSGLLDVVGILLTGLVASVAASSFGASGAQLTIAGIQVPAIDEDSLIALVLIVLGVFTLKAVVALWLTRRMVRLVARVETRNAGRIAALMLTTPLPELQSYSKAQFQYATTTSTASLFTGVLDAVAIIVSEGFLLVVVLASFFLVDPIAAVATLLYFGLVIVVIQGAIGATIKRAGEDSAAGMVDTTNGVNDSIDSFREISVLDKQDAFIERITEARGRVARAGATFRFLAGMPRYIVETALILGVVAFVGVQFFTGQLATGIVTIGVFLTGGVRVMASLLPLQASAAGIARYRREAALAMEFLTREADPDRVRSSAEATTSIDVDAPLRVDLDDVRYAYPGDGGDTLRGITMQIEPGSFTALIGPSGAGKTTLVDVVLGLIPPAAGTVLVGGAAPGALRRGHPGAISYVPQKPGIVTGTIAENVAIGSPAADIDRDRVLAVLDAAFLTEFVDSLPDGIDTRIGAQGDGLSGGQVQRMGLARALYPHPRLLILDEATSGLDAASEEFISQSLRRLHGDVTVVVIAHRLSTVQHADVVHVLQEGQLVASGTFSHLRRTVPLVEEYARLMTLEEQVEGRGERPR